MTSTSTVVHSLRVRPELWLAAQRAAQARGVTVNALVVAALEAALAVPPQQAASSPAARRTRTRTVETVDAGAHYVTQPAPRPLPSPPAPLPARPERWPFTFSKAAQVARSPRLSPSPHQQHQHDQHQAQQQHHE